MKHLASFCSLATAQSVDGQKAHPLPDTKISGVYEVMLGVGYGIYAIK